jgi:DNA invertase Pin-like site-specific DNA recombinase
MKTAAVYLRVSTDKQTVENQRAEVEQLARARGYEPSFYEETESAAKARPVFDRMLKDARAGRVQAIAVAALDRMHRTMRGSIEDVLEMDRLGVRVLSVREGWLDTEGPVRPLLVAIFGWVAEQERAVLIQRTRAGMARAKEQGQRFGRPRASPIKVAAALARVREGATIEAAAKAAGLGYGTVRRALAAA